MAVVQTFRVISEFLSSMKCLGSSSPKDLIIFMTKLVVSPWNWKFLPIYAGKIGLHVRTMWIRRVGPGCHVFTVMCHDLENVSCRRSTIQRSAGLPNIPFWSFLPQLQSKAAPFSVSLLFRTDNSIIVIWIWPECSFFTLLPDFSFSVSGVTMNFGNIQCQLSQYQHPVLLYWIQYLEPLLLCAHYKLPKPVLLMLMIHCDKKEEFQKTWSVHLKEGGRSWVAEEVFHDT